MQKLGAASRAVPEGREPFTNQKRWVVTEHDCEMKWGLDGDGFRCALCGHRFKPGDGARWIYAAGRTFKSAEGKTFGVCNFKTCDACDGPDVLDRWVARNVEFFSDRFWALR